jgi:hypothetical protein
MGSLFGALPIAVLESGRDPNAFKEAAFSILENASPLDLGIDEIGRMATGKGEPDLTRIAHVWARNVALMAGVADLMANEDWKGSAIVPKRLENMQSSDQFDHSTTTIGKLIGQVVPGMSPLEVDHILNTYTGNLYRRTIGMLDTLSGSTLSDPQTLPIVGTLFLKAGTSRVIGDFYERQDHLTKLDGSGVATLEEIGELTESRRLSRQLSALWKKRRTELGSDASRKQQKKAADEITAKIQGLIREHNKLEDADHRSTGLGKLAYEATGPSAEEADIARAVTLLGDVSTKEALAALRSEYRRREFPVRVRTSSGKLTSYGKRLARLRALKIEGE